MNTPKNNAPFSLLIFLQILITYAVGISGNKVSEIISIPPAVLIIGTVALLLLSYVLTVAMLPRPDKDTQSAHKRFSVNLNNLFPNKIVTMFPFGILSGLLIGFLCIAFTPNGDVSILTKLVPGFYGMAVFELVGIVIATIIFIAINAQKNDRALILTYAIGFAVGMSNIILFLRPTHRVASTVFGWLVVMTIVALFTQSQTVRGVLTDLSNSFSDITKER